ncbi:multiple epidermal growth factor-like domains protein 10 [Saccostrea echinata]|uniref:multiple epidermal growth factor-like domains protein 10 n=1 Tax=Saccostrea echinata TaxID=191078 RepID=UPI002A828EDB|nr:multiple epidermal growth factor-like domains protein 10 [Saccostrea echinata]
MTECKNRTYGLKCIYKCGHCLNGVPCDVETGSCGTECDPGYLGDLCDKACENGSYGPSCNFTCGHCLNRELCDKGTGMCSTGCDPGYFGDRCHEECLPGMFGTNCSYFCSGHCSHNESCYHVDGICKIGCTAGYRGNYCDIVCEPGFYGINCKEKCSKGCQDSCNRIDGFCRCNAGWTGFPKCNIECPSNFFGIDCRHLCSDHCGNNDTCSGYYGTCDGGCQEPFIGRICDHQIRAQGPGTLARIILTTRFGVERQQRHLAGFSLYISNTSRREEGFLCYKDLSTLELPDLDFSTRCIKYGRFVIFYNERIGQTFYSSSRYENPALTELCDVVVRGCYQTGVYGYSCNINCPINCQGRRCDIVNGYCLGCTEGWSGSKCNQACPSGWYGLECKLSCSGNCRYSDTCNHVTGRCDRGCTSGWKDYYCDKQCDPGTYGPNCENTCSGHCFNGTSCSIVTGNCDNGCYPGYTGDLCDTECLPGYFGMRCRDNCSGHCLHNQSCHHVDGVCKNGCTAGYRDTQCFNICTPGFYGMKCKETCSHRCLEICNHIDGFCSCAPGWMEPPTCNTECPDGFFGVDCGFQCSDNCVNNETCNRFEGTCDRGCQGSYSGLICDHQVFSPSFKVLVTYKEVDCEHEGPSPAGSHDGLLEKWKEKDTLYWKRNKEYI